MKLIDKIYMFIFVVISVLMVYVEISTGMNSIDGLFYGILCGIMMTAILYTPVLFIKGFNNGRKRMTNLVEGKKDEYEISKDAKWAEFQNWKDNYQSTESSKQDIEKQWLDFDKWKANKSQ